MRASDRLITSVLFLSASALSGRALEETARACESHSVACKPSPLARKACPLVHKHARAVHGQAGFVRKQNRFARERAPVIRKQKRLARKPETIAGGRLLPTRKYQPLVTSDGSLVAAIGRQAMRPVAGLSLPRQERERHRSCASG